MDIDSQNTGSPKVKLDPKSLEIKGIIPVSMLDWAGKLSTVLFLPKCNFQCFYCQNWELVQQPDEIDDVSWTDIKNHLLSRKDWLDGLVVTGGEPTIYGALLEELLEKLKELGYPIKLDTNGALPGVLERLITRKLVDYVAMDVKTVFEKYTLVAKVPVETENIKESIELIKSSNMGHEFRTTVIPGYVEKEDITIIAKYVSGANQYYLQQFNPNNTLAPPQARGIKPFSRAYLEFVASECKKYVPTQIRE